MLTGRSHKHETRRAVVAARFAGVALLCMAAALATAGAASPLRTSTAAPTGQVWAFAFPSSVKSVSNADVDWLASRGITAIVAPKLSPTSLQRLGASASRANLIVIAPRAITPRTSCRSTAGVLRTCAATAPTPAAAIKLARRSVVDYVIVRVRSLQGVRMLRGSQAGRSRIVALLPLNKTTAWRASIAYASADPVLDLGVSSPRVEPARSAASEATAARANTEARRLTGTDGSARDGVLRPHQDDCVACLEGRARQRSRRRLPALPERCQRRHQGNARLHLQGTQVRDEVHVRARRVRRGRKHLYSR